MALWQFPVELIPTRAHADPIDCARLDLEDLWKGYSLAAELVAKEIDSIIPRAKPWCPGLARWGDDKTDDLQLWFEDERILCLTARFDTRIHSSDFIGRVAQVTSMLDLSAVLPDKIVAKPTAELLMEHTRRSLAAAFALPAQGEA